MWNRSRALRTAVALTAVLLLPSVSACSDQTAEANRAIAAANAQVAAYTRAGAELESLMAEARSLAMSSSVDASRGVELTDRMTAALDRQRAAAALASGQLAKVSDMRVSEELRTYAGKEVAVVNGAAKEGLVARTLVSEMRSLYEMVGSGSVSKDAVAQASARIEDGTRELSVIDAEITRLEKAAAAYYDQQGLGGK